MPRVLNFKRGGPDGAVYIGRAMPRYRLRASRWRNPFKVGRRPRRNGFDRLSASPDQACMHFGAISARSQDCLPIPARDRAERHLVCATPNRAGPAGPLTGCSGRLATAVLCSDDTT